MSTTVVIVLLVGCVAALLWLVSIGWKHGNAERAKSPPATGLWWPRQLFRPASESRAYAFGMLFTAISGSAGLLGYPWVVYAVCAVALLAYLISVASHSAEEHNGVTKMALGAKADAGESHD